MDNLQEGQAVLWDMARMKKAWFQLTA